ncbi:hypothetical protein H1C71_026825, partial [Ictidomys tridecemlineatus]
DRGFGDTIVSMLVVPKSPDRAGLEIEHSKIRRRPGKVGLGGTKDLLSKEADLSLMGAGLHILEGRMRCQLKSSGFTSGSWQFGFNGQMWLRFDSDNRRWTKVHPGSNRMKEKWEDDREMTKFLHKTSMGDCRTWLEKFLVEWKTELEPTGPSSAIINRVSQESTASTLVPSALLLILTCFIHLGLQTFLTG